MKKPGTSVSQFANVTDSNMASKKELVVIAAMLLLEEDDEEVKEKKRIWSRHWLLERKNKGYFGQLLPDLAVTTHQDLKNLCEWILIISKR